MLIFSASFTASLGNHFFLEYVGSGFGRLDHFDDLAVGAAFAFLEAMRRFSLPYLRIYLISFVNGYSLKDGVVFLKFKSLSVVFLRFLVVM